MKLNLTKSKVFVFGLLLMAFTTTAQVDISGTVLDANNNDPLIGATIIVPGTSNGTVTDIDGSFSFTVTDVPVNLEISYTGYTGQSLTVNNADPISVALSAGLNIDEVVVTGSRGKPRTILNSAVPIDNINARELKLSGQKTVDQMINYKVPSYNSTPQTVSDGTAHFDPSELRNLGPSRTLVLINGKRKNQSAQVYLNRTPGRGEVGTDMKAIPAAAIERIEVLRDGASAQYGSDAVAGVINIILKERVTPGEITLEGGVTQAGDGAQFGADLNTGFSIGKKGGFLNFTGEYYHQDYTNRPGTPGGDGLFGFLYEIGAIPVQAAGGFPAAPGVVATASQIANGDTDWQRANPDLGMIVGQPEYDKASAYVNLGLPHGKGEFYINGGYTHRDGTSFALFRVPWWPGLPNANPATGGSFQGFHPTFESAIDDITFSIGNKWLINDWDIDLSLTTGSNDIDYTVSNSINPSLGPTGQTSFNPGGYKFGILVGNLDFAKAINDLSLSFGAEFRRENFEVRAGEEASYIDGGVQSFPGLQPSNALEEDRSNVGLYVGADYDLSKSTLIGAAARFENYSDFGSNFSWKINARQLLGGENFALRASYSTGFRAPSLHQIYLSNIQTLFVDGNIAQQGTFNNVSDVARTLGVPELDAEISRNFTIGLTGKIGNNLSITADYYNINVDDRVLLSNQISRGALPDGNSLKEDLIRDGVESFTFFINAIDSRTQGVDVVVNLGNLNAGEKGRLGFTLAANYNETSLKGEPTAPPVLAENNIEIFNREERNRLVTGRPQTKVSLGANYRAGKFRASINNTYFGEVTETHPANEAFDQVFSGKTLTDLILGYQAGENIGLDITINNIFNVFPDELRPVDDFEANLGGRFRYAWHVNQFGFTGTIFKVGVNIKL